MTRMSRSSIVRGASTWSLVLTTMLGSVFPAFAATQTPEHGPTAGPSAEPRYVCDGFEDPEKYENPGLRILTKGQGDWLFRKMEMQVRPPISSAILNEFAILNAELRRKNVRLLVAVTPPRGAMMKDFLDPLTVEKQHFDSDVAMRTYLDTVKRLKSIGILVPDTLATWQDASLSLPDIKREFYRHADLHWSAFGAYAQSIAIARALNNEPEIKALANKQFVTSAPTKLATPEVYLAEASHICKVPYSPVARPLFKTVEVGGDSGGGLLGDNEIQIAMVGTSFSTVQEGNFNGFLKQALHADIANYGISGGGFDSSILSYLLSDDYINSKPKLLIWEMQQHNLTDTENFPLILGAAQGDCGNSAVYRANATTIKLGKTIIASVDSQARSRTRGTANLVIDVNAPDPRHYHLNLTYSDGQTNRFDIDAGRWPHPANKLILRLPRDGQDLAEVSLVADQKMVGTVSAHVCRAV